MKKYISSILKDEVIIKKLYSVHYFSQQFKHITSMSPIEYSHSIKALIS